MNGRNYTNFESNLAMMEIYLPVKFEFDWTKRFRVRVQKREMLTDRQTDVGHAFDASKIWNDLPNNVRS